MAGRAFAPGSTPRRGGLPEFPPDGPGNSGGGVLEPMKKLAALVFAAVGPVLPNVQIFEQDLAGIHPYLGVLGNSKIIQPLVGFEYNIEGRTSLGVRVGKPLKDTLSFDTDLKAFFANPYAVFEFIEPGNLTVVSFAMRADFVYEDVTKPKDNYNGFTRSAYGGGPVFGLRFQTSDKWVVIPEASYELFYVQWRMNDLFAPNPNPPPQTSPVHVEEKSIRHDVAGGVHVLYRFTEMHGLDFAPRVVVKIGKGLQNSDFLNVDVSFGYFLSF
jgi:hypothetical protein